jgi:bifunctional N-acetylglucosamine-1-phosphate-uridyltransferase/glucosamine-1-phosphate-acetyltransferase GlmU-like protein
MLIIVGLFVPVPSAAVFAVAVTIGAATSIGNVAATGAEASWFAPQAITLTMSGVMLGSGTAIVVVVPVNALVVPPPAQVGIDPSTV